MRAKSCLFWLVVFWIGQETTAQAQQLPRGLSLPPSLNFATSPTPIGSGARAAGKANAFIAVADDATAASHNPGALIQLQDPEFSIVGSYFVRSDIQDVTRPATAVEDQTLSSFDLNYLSVVYPFEVFQRNVVVSLNVQRLFDLRGATDVVSRFAELEGVQRVHSRQKGGFYTFSPAAAVQITPTFSVGMAFNIWPNLFGNGWKQEVSVRSEGFVNDNNDIVPFTSDGRIKEDFDFEGFNVTAGFLWTINSVFSLGGVFRSPFTAKVHRTHTSSLTFILEDRPVPMSPDPCHFRETLDMDMPVAYGLGLAARLSDQLILSLDVSRIHWSAFRLEESHKEQDCTFLVENGAPSGKGEAVLRGASDDTTSVRLGAEYVWVRPQMRIPFRAGMFYDPEPGAGGTDNFFGFSLGSGLAIGPFVMDLAHTFRTGEVRGEATDTTVYQHSVLASVIYHF